MLAQKNRLKLKKSNSPKILPKKIISGPFVLKYEKTQQPFKLAIVISKKTAKKAVDRNRVKRTLQEAARQIAMPNLDLIVIVKENIASLKTEEVKKHLENALKKI